jgi:hypothetical protein
VCRRIGSFVVRAEVRFHFNDAAGDELPLFCPSDQYFAEQPRGDVLGRSLEERSVHRLARKLHRY